MPMIESAVHLEGHLGAKLSQFFVGRQMTPALLDSVKSMVILYLIDLVARGELHSEFTRERDWERRFSELVTTQYDYDNRITIDLSFLVQAVFAYQPVRSVRVGLSPYLSAQGSPRRAPASSFEEELERRALRETLLRPNPNLVASREKIGAEVQAELKKQETEEEVDAPVFGRIID